ncbi:MAG: MFS transporter [Verrucomicrobiae bacterium]|nr:MFS transporter [Verrucomicrobiae bacterium]
MESERTLVTYRYERIRAMANGILEMAGSTFLLLIAVRYLQAGAFAKALVAGGGSAGLIVSPFVVWWVSRNGLNSTGAASKLAAVGSFTFLLMTVLPFLPVFVLGSIVTMACASSMIPLLTQVYQENYPSEQRGRLFSRTVMIRISVAAVFSEVAGRLLSHFNDYKWLLLIFAASFGVAHFCLARIPSQRLKDSGGSNPFRAMRFVKTDKLFRDTLICWMLMGAANLMMLPLRIEYLANPKYSQALDVKVIALLLGVIPNIIRLIMSPLWGWLFDHMNFFALRVILNLGFAMGILTFFTSDTIDGLLVSAIIYGLSSAGGDVAWSLWVTKFAPSEHVADYMSIHTFFTGVRGVLAPVIAFHLAAANVPLTTLAFVCVGMIALASLLLLFELKSDIKGKKTVPLVEEVGD